MPTATLTAFIGLTGHTVYAVLYGAADRSTVWNGSAFVAYGTSARNAGVVSLPESATTGRYDGVTPVLPAGTYYQETFIRLGGSPATSDTNVTLDGPLPVVVSPAATSPQVTITLDFGPPAGRFPYLVLANSSDDPPAECWDGAMGEFGDYTGAAYQSGAAAFTETSPGVYTCVLDDALPNFALLPPGDYWYQVFDRQGGSPSRTADAANRWASPTPLRVAAAPATPRPVPLAWGLPPPPQQDIRLAVGEDVRLAFAATAGADPAAVGTAVTVACRHPLTGAVALAVAAVLDPTAGSFTADLAAADTALLDPLLTYRWDATRTDAGAAARLACGRLFAAASQR